MSATFHRPTTEPATVALSERATELARLLPLWPVEIADITRAGRARLIARLEHSLKAERRRGRDGHWTYDLARHAALLAMCRSEREALAALCDVDRPKR